MPSVHAPGFDISRQTITPSPEGVETRCGGCEAVVGTNRASTLSSLGWRLAFVRDDDEKPADRWFCSACRGLITLTLTQSEGGSDET